MVPLILAALFASEPVNGQPPTVFTADDIAALRVQAERECGYASPQDLMRLAGDERRKSLPCLIEATVKHTGPLLPKTIEPGATIVSVSSYGQFPIFVLRLAPDHPRASVPKDQPSDYDDLLSTRTCNDQWLGGLIDAGMDSEAQGSTLIVYKLESQKGEVLAAIAVARCFDPK